MLKFLTKMTRAEYGPPLLKLLLLLLLLELSGSAEAFESGRD